MHILELLDILSCQWRAVHIQFSRKVLQLISCSSICTSKWLVTYKLQVISPSNSFLKEHNNHSTNTVLCTVLTTFLAEKDGENTPCIIMQNFKLTCCFTIAVVLQFISFRNKKAFHSEEVQILDPYVTSARP